MIEAPGVALDSQEQIAKDNAGTTITPEFRFRGYNTAAAGQGTGDLDLTQADAKLAFTASVEGGTGGAISNLDAETGTFTFTPATGFEGLAKVTYSFDYPVFLYDHTNDDDTDDQDGVDDSDEIAGRRTSNTGTIYIQIGSPVTVALTVGDLTEANEDQGVGWLLPLNSDDDNENAVADYDDLQGPYAKEDDVLTEVDVDVQFTRTDLVQSDYTGLFTISTSGDGRNIRLWTDAQKSQEIFPRINDGTVYKGETYAFAEIPGTLYVEGLSAGTDTIDLVVTSTDMTFEGVTATTAVTNHGVWGNVSDAVNLTALTLDLDIDSDNDGVIQGSDWEEALEDNEYGLGKLVLQSSVLAGHTPPATFADYTPVQLKVPPGLDDTDPALKVRIDFDPATTAGIIKLWTVPKDHVGKIDADANAGGHRVLPEGEYTLDKLGYNAGAGTITLYIDGARQSSLVTLKDVEDVGKPQETIKATFVSSTGDLLSDEVKYIVTNPPSFFWELQTRPELRSELAARGVYVKDGSSDDLPDFSLELLTSQDLLELGVPPGIAGLMNGTNAVPGFQAVLYRDYITDSSDFVLAFAGTDDLHDWIDNIWQGLGWDSAQYLSAMKIANAITDVPQLFTDTRVSGHSLGGGLASAAAVVSGFPTHTFNAAGLNEKTLYRRNANGDLLTDPNGNYIEIYPNSLARYNNANGLIHAYYVDWDILSFIQDHTPGIVSALGFRDEMDGPHDQDMIIDAGLLAVLHGSQQHWLAAFVHAATLATMTEAHLHPSILYGLLVDEQLEIDLLGYDF